MHKILFYNNFIIRLYMLQALCAHHQVVKIVLYSIWYHHTCRWPVHRLREDFLSSLFLKIWGTQLFQNIVSNVWLALSIICSSIC